MQIVDIVISCILILGLLLGYKRGGIAQLFSILGLIGGFILAGSYYTLLSENFIQQYVESIRLSNVLSFLLIWLALFIAIGAIGRLFSLFFEKIYMGWLDRFLGAIFGCVKALFLLSLVINLLDVIDSDNKLLSETNRKESLLYIPTKHIAKSFYSLIEEVNIENL